MSAATVPLWVVGCSAVAPSPGFGGRQRELLTSIEWTTTILR
jgi:hypothetical protein